MSGLNDLARGLRCTFTRPALVALLWAYALCLLLTALFAVALFLWVAQSTAGSVIATDLRQGQTPDWLVDLAGQPETAVSVLALIALAALLVAVYLVLVVVASGGEISAVARALGVQLAFPADTFWAASIRHAVVIARLAILELAALALAVVALIVVRFLGARASPGHTFAWVWLAGAILSLALLTAIFDLARIELVVRGGRSAIEACVRAVRLSAGSALSVIFLTLSSLALAFVAAGLLIWLHSGIGKQTALGVLLGLGVGQLSVLARLWARLAAYGAEASLWSRKRVAE